MFDKGPLAASQKQNITIPPQHKRQNRNPRPGGNQWEGNTREGIFTTFDIQIVYGWGRLWGAWGRDEVFEGLGSAAVWGTERFESRAFIRKTKDDSATSAPPYLLTSLESSNSEFDLDWNA